MFWIYRLDLLQQAYGGYYVLYGKGLKQLKLLFPSLGIVSGGAVALPDHFPGNVSIHSFIVQNAHKKEDVIKS